MAFKKKNKTIQIRVDESDRQRIDLLYKTLDEFNLSVFVRRSIRELCKQHNIKLDGVNYFTVQ